MAKPARRWAVTDPDSRKYYEAQLELGTHATLGQSAYGPWKEHEKSTRSINEDKEEA